MDLQYFLLYKGWCRWCHIFHFLPQCKGSEPGGALPLQHLLFSVAEGEQCNQNSECETDLLCDGNLKKCRKRDPRNQSGFCSVNGRLCQEAEGDCDKHRECEGSLLCGTFGQFDNKMCQFFDPTYPPSWDCCFSPNATTGFSRVNEPCKIDEQCESSLKCDTNHRYHDEPNTYLCKAWLSKYELTDQGPRPQHEFSKLSTIKI